MAYVLGFFAADGTMVQNKRGAHFIEFHITDQELLEDIRCVMGSNHVIGVRERGGRCKTGYRLQIGSKELFADLARLGFCQNKSTQLTLPKIPKRYLGAYLRGYFDGDGCVYFKQLVVKARKNPKWIFQVRFTCGTKSYLDDVLNMVRGIGVTGGYIQHKQRGFELVFSHRDGLALYRHMYNNTGTNFVYLARKKEIFDRAMMTLFGVRS